MHNFIIGPTDTDSISFCKEDFGSFSEEERNSLLKELNSLFPEGLVWEDDGYYECVVAIKSKNYVLYDGKTIKIKGSALKATTKEPALKEFINRTIESMIFNKNNYVDLYNEYVLEINNITDIKRWSTRKTITEKVLSSERTNEEKVRDAIEDSEYVEGDRAYFYFKPDESLGLIEHFDGSYHKDKLYEKLYKTACVFETIIPKETFINYKLKRSKILLEGLNAKV